MEPKPNDYGEKITKWTLLRYFLALRLLAALDALTRWTKSFLHFMGR